VIYKQIYYELSGDYDKAGFVFRCKIGEEVFRAKDVHGDYLNLFDMHDNIVEVGRYVD